MTIHYDVLVRCTAKRLPTILQALEGAAELQSVTVVDDGQPEPPPKRQNAYVNHKRDKGISGTALVLELIKRDGGTITTEALKEGFAARGFSTTSVSPYITRLQRSGLIETVGRGEFKITPAGVESRKAGAP